MDGVVRVEVVGRYSVARAYAVADQLLILVYVSCSSAAQSRPNAGIAFPFDSAASTSP